MIDDRLSDADLAAHGVDRDHRTGELASPHFSHCQLQVPELQVAGGRFEVFEG